MFRTGQVLHLEYGKLKRVMNGKMGKTSAPTAFVELAPLAAMGGDECVLEQYHPIPAQISLNQAEADLMKQGAARAANESSIQQVARSHARHSIRK